MHRCPYCSCVLPAPHQANLGAHPVHRLQRRPMPLRPVVHPSPLYIPPIQSYGAAMDEDGSIWWRGFRPVPRYIGHPLRLRGV